MEKTPARSSLLILTVTATHTRFGFVCLWSPHRTACIGGAKQPMPFHPSDDDAEVGVVWEWMHPVCRRQCVVYRCGVASWKPQHHKGCFYTTYRNNIFLCIIASHLRARVRTHARLLLQYSLRLCASCWGRLLQHLPSRFHKKSLAADTAEVRCFWIAITDCNWATVAS